MYIVYVYISPYNETFYLLWQKNWSTGTKTKTSKDQYFQVWLKLFYWFQAESQHCIPSFMVISLSVPELKNFKSFTIYEHDGSLGHLTHIPRTNILNSIMQCDFNQSSSYREYFKTTEFEEPRTSVTKWPWHLLFIKVHLADCLNQLCVMTIFKGFLSYIWA